MTKVTPAQDLMKSHNFRGHTTATHVQSGTLQGDLSDNKPSNARRSMFLSPPRFQPTEPTVCRRFSAVRHGLRPSESACLPRSP